MEIPLVDEIRDAREASQDSHDATMHMARIEAALTSLAVMERQLMTHPNLDEPIPGEEIVDLLCERWEMLADLQVAGPRPAQPMSVKLRLRRTQMDLANQALRPLKKEASIRAARLHHLQHEQRHQLDQPEFAEVVSELATIGIEREQVSGKLEPMKQRLALVDPAQNLLDTFVHRLEHLLGESGNADPNGLFAWRAASMTHTLLAALVEVLGQLKLELPMPNTLEVPERPDLALSTAHWVEVKRVAEELSALQKTLRQEGEGLHAIADELNERFEQLTQQIVDRMG